MNTSAPATPIGPPPNIAWRPHDRYQHMLITLYPGLARPSELRCEASVMCISPVHLRCAYACASVHRLV